ncbi:MAG: hypothetical protein K6T90_08310 [Leptolyngbyaceae cyanobacterium HOT.MB2.61]|jgi:hypothetical protein|nr:hypothetical protein [Leptolyngbyaceae cyanobacterium HOT.MB2.61]
MFLTLLMGSAIAHEVEVAGDVAGTWHIEPNHNPKAGISARAWIALTRKGGGLLPLDQAKCQMAVYTKPRKPGAAPILRPPLKAVSAERYRGIPGADITFPNVGLYQLELDCTPKTPGRFKPFQMQYDVTVTR